MTEQQRADGLRVIEGGVAAPNAVLKTLSLTGFKSFMGRTTLEFAPGITAIIGPNGSGKCVIGSTPVTLADGSEIDIRELVESALARSIVQEQMGDGILTRENPHGVRVLSLDPLSLRLSGRNVYAFIKRKAPDVLIRITTRSGRLITATPYHPLFTLADGALRVVRADELRPGTRVALPRRLPVDGGLPPVAGAIGALRPGDGVYVPSTEELREWASSERAKFGSWATWSRLAGVDSLHCRHIAAGQAVDVGVLGRLAGVSSTPLPAVTAVRSKNGHSVRWPEQLTPETARLLGLLLSEGHSERTFVQFTNADEAVNAYFARQMTSEFGLTVTREQRQGGILTETHSRALIALLDRVFLFRARTQSKDKEIPPQIFAATAPIQWAFLSGLFEGDAHVVTRDRERRRARISYTTASEKMARQVASLLLRLGVFASVFKYTTFATNTSSRTRRTYWRAVIDGADQASRAAAGLSFIGDKDRALAELRGLHLRAMPNVDVIPDVSALMRAAARAARVVAGGRREWNDVRSYRQTGKNATRHGLMRAALKIEQRADDPKAARPFLDRLMALATSDVYWDQVAAVEAVAPEDEWVYDLAIEDWHNFVAGDLVVHNSNIQEGIRWTLAETNARHLRAKRGEELIFGGSETKRSLGMAEVILQIDNSSRRLPIDFAEVEISRRIYRSGESEYYINGARVRLRDLEELLAGANLADNPFVVIGQGLVDQVLALRPSDRRLVIEEAAGVRRLHERREDALQRLKGAEAELVRVIDILREIGPRVEMLREQAAKWHEYETIRNELRRRAIRWYRSSFGETAKTRADLAARLASVDAETRRFTDQIDETSSQSAVSDEELREAREEEERRRIGLADALTEESALRERIAALQASIDAVGAERGRSRTLMATLPADLAALRSRRATHDDEAQQAARLARDAADAARDAEEEASRTRVALAEAQAAKVETLLRGQAAALRDAVERAEKQIAEAHPTELPAGLKWLPELGEGIAIASTRAAVLGIRARGLSVIVPDDVDVATPPGCERLPGQDLRNVFLAPDRRTALAAARGLAAGLVVTSDGFAASPGLVHIVGASSATMATLLARLREELAMPDGPRDVGAAEAAERAAFDAHAAAAKAAEDARLEAATSEERRSSVVRLRDALDERIADTERRIAQEEERVRALAAQEEDARSRLALAQADLGRASADAREAERSAEIARSRALAAEGSRRESEQRLARARERLAELRGERSKLAVEEERASGALRLLEEQVRAELGLAEDEPLPDPGTLEGDEDMVGDKERANVVRDLQRLRHKLIALEPVNPLAATELAEIGQRHDFLQAQKADLEKAISDLRTLADELATTIAEQFSTTLMAVDREFGLFFQRLFNGGEARLRTTDDPEAPGIDIVARPPGKRIGSLNQLSGGERALTAVALLLAILRVRPAPFCVLDEVDAALDERNIGRFNQALRELTDRTQFIVITHNRGTIEAADTLYGVSMDEGGVSKVISMRLAEAPGPPGRIEGLAGA